jgi:ATP-dependent DNA helicase RecG
MKEKEWAQLLERGTGQFTEMVSCYRISRLGKIHPRSRKELLQAVAESLSAMANAGGGTVFLGADAEAEALGVFFDDRERRLFPGLLKDFFYPPIPFQVGQEEVEGKLLLRFVVLPSPVLHLLKNGKGYLRVGPKNVHLSRERVATLRESRAETWHEREILPGSSLNDLQEGLIQEFIDHLGLRGDGERILHRPYGLIEYYEGKPLLTRAAAYLFGKDPLRWHPRPGIDLVRFEGREGIRGGGYNVAERIRIEAPILKLVKEAEKEIAARVQEQVVPRDLFFREKFEYPAFSWQEGLINAIAHRDYSLEGSAISVWMFDDRMEIRSPGGLPRPVKVEQILRHQKVHYARNPLIARVLTDAGFMRGLGEGLPRVFQEMDQHGLNPPELGEEENFCCLLFRNTPVFDETTVSWMNQFRDYPLNSRQKRILAYARVHGGIFRSTDYQKFGVDRDAAYGEIKDLVRQGIVVPLKKHGKVYRVQEVQEGGPTLPGLTWLMEPLKEKGFFTLQEIKLPPSLSWKKARSIIRTLNREGYFKSSGKGRATRYEPTEKLKRVCSEEGKGSASKP